MHRGEDRRGLKDDVVAVVVITIIRIQSNSCQSFHDPLKSGSSKVTKEAPAGNVLSHRARESSVPPKSRQFCDH